MKSEVDANFGVSIDRGRVKYVYPTRATLTTSFCAAHAYLVVVLRLGDKTHDHSVSAKENKIMARVALPYRIETPKTALPRLEKAMKESSLLH